MLSGAIDDGGERISSPPNPAETLKPTSIQCVWIVRKLALDRAESIKFENSYEDGLTDFLFIRA
jgi:hypothetical protein